jgi:hypothetical protein
LDRSQPGVLVGHLLGGHELEAELAADAIACVEIRDGDVDGLDRRFRRVLLW